MEEKQRIQGVRFYPLMASNRGVEEEQSSEEAIHVWGRFDLLSDEKKRLLLSYEVAEKLSLAEKNLHISPEITNKMAVAVREILFGEVTEEQIVTSLGNEISSYIQNEILALEIPPEVTEDESELEAEQQEDTSVITSSKKLQILKAISEYPNLGNQIISSERIRIKSQPEPVRGSLLNWIKYYRDELGIGQHSTVERGQFLFGSVNGKALSSLERERVNIILKSLEENLPLEIDTERQEVIFPVIDTEASVQQLPVLPSQGEIQVMSQPLKTELPIPPAFVPQPLPSKQADQNAIARKFQPSPSPYQKISIPPQPLSPERMGTSNVGIDVSQVAEKLKREPKPEWIKGAFTKESIPDTAPVAKAVGSMSFSFNHALPAEQEVKPPKSTAPQISEQAPKPAVPVSSEPAVVSSGPIKGAVPPIASPRPRASQFHIRPVSQRD